MFNILQLRLLIARGSALINKGILNNGFIWLVSMLTVWLLIHTLYMNPSSTYILLNVVLSSVVLLAIKTKSLLCFYIFFEMRVVPITLIIFLYGYQPEKIQASLFLFVYTVGGSLPLLIYIVYSEFHLTSYIAIPITVAFIVKTPIYLLHIWLPKAHVEAPVGGSIVLAGVLLKLGSYGLLVFLPYIKINILLSFYLTISFVGSVICSFICIRQGDIKLLIAYSSIVHMSVVNIGFIRGTELGYCRRIMIVVGHGLCSPFIFQFSYLLYQSTHSRLTINNTLACPLMMGLMMGIVSLNMGTPPRISLWSEVIVAIRTLFLFRWSWVVFLFVFFLRVVYNLYLYTSCIHAKFSVFTKEMKNKYILPLLQLFALGYGSFFFLDLFHISSLLNV